MEIEAKFRVDDDQTFGQLLELGSIGPFQLDAGKDQRPMTNEPTFVVRRSSFVNPQVITWTGSLHMEIEAKFRVDDERTFQQLLELRSIGPFRLAAEPEVEDQRNVYFDTADRRLRAGQYGLRVRDMGERRIATLKGAAQARDGIYERDEWEVEIGDDDRPSAWPPSEARDRALALLGGAEPLPILAIRTRRRHIIAARGDTRLAELSLDEGTIDAGGRAASFRELEIELLKAGTRTDLEELAALLRARFALVPEDRSKLARGLELLDGVEPQRH